MPNNGFTPSPYQEAIFGAWTDPAPEYQHLSVNAVAGSGKSTTLEHALKKTNELSLFCAFNKLIVEAAQPRFAGTRVKIATGHSIGMQTLNKHLPKKPRLDDNKYRRLVREYLQEYKGEYKDDREAAKRIGDLIKFARLTLTDYTDLGALIKMANRHNLDFEINDKNAVQTLLNHGQRLAESNGEIDFTDMLYLPARLKMQPFQFQRVAVDECQDLSTAARRLIISCCAPGGRMLFVGDPKQAIMGFAGADANSHHEIHHELDTQELALSICYRCPAGIVTMAQEIVPQIEPRPGAPAGTIDLRTEEDILREARPGDLIMCRRTAPLLKHCLHLIRSKIHARVRGRDVGKELANLLRIIGSTIS